MDEIQRWNSMKKKANEKIDEGISFREHNQEFASQFVQLLMGFALWLSLPVPDCYCWLILKHLKDNIRWKHLNMDVNFKGSHMTNGML